MLARFVPISGLLLGRRSALGERRREGMKEIINDHSKGVAWDGGTIESAGALGLWTRHISGQGSGRVGQNSEKLEGG
jgi:hypothetical protein